MKASKGTSSKKFQLQRLITGVSFFKKMCVFVLELSSLICLKTMMLGDMVFSIDCQPIFCIVSFGHDFECQERRDFDRFCWILTSHSRKR